MSQQLDTVLSREPVKEPSKSWKNQYKLVETATPGTIGCYHCGHIKYISPGDVWLSHCKTFPSADIAETMALRHMLHPEVEYQGPVEV
jgi:hypothetical protein